VKDCLANYTVGLTVLAAIRLCQVLIAWHSLRKKIEH